MSEEGHVRASDRERDRTAAVLSAHWSEGRLDLAELDRRTEVAYGATTRGELAALLRDLPADTVRLPVARTEQQGRRRRFFLPGMVSFREAVELHDDREVVYDQALAHIVPAMSAAGYHVVAMDRPGMLRFVRTTAPDWAPAAAILTFGAGLLAYAIRVERPVTVLLLPIADGGTKIVAFGEAPRGVRRAFAMLRD
jgi:hypothetical protein